jgi:preprotein translocase subunit SecG
MIYTLFVVLIVLAAVMMIIIVLIQESKGGGLSSNFSSSNQIMGVRKTTDIVEKTTWGLAIAMVVFSVICAYVAPRASTEQSVLENIATQTETTNPANTPGFGVGQQAAPANQEAPAAQEAAPAQEKAAAPAAPAKK